MALETGIELFIRELIYTLTLMGKNLLEHNITPLVISNSSQVSWVKSI